MFALLSARAVAAAATVESARTGDMIKVVAQAAVRAPLTTVWGTLIDYERLPEFVPGMKTSRVIARKGATVTVAQTGEARFLFFTIPIDVTVESTELPHHTIEVQRIAGSVRHLQGRYEVQLMATEPPLVQLRWNGSIAPESDLPPLIGQALLRNLIKTQFAGLVREIERRAAALALASRKPMSMAALPLRLAMAWLLRTGWLLCAVLAATGCALLPAPVRLDRSSTAPEVVDCVDWYSALDAQVERAGVRDAGAARIAGFPQLRVDRFTASLRDSVSLDTSTRLNALVQRLQQLDLQAREFEIANLPAQARAHLTGSAALASGTGDAQQRLQDCAARLSAFDLASPTRTRSLLARLYVPDDYASSYRLLGLYALTRLPFAHGIARFEAQRRAAFAKGDAAPPGSTRLRLSPPIRTTQGSLLASQLARMLAAPPQDPLAVPAPSVEDMELLYAHYAPSFDIDIASNDDQPGAPVWTAEALAVDTRQSVVYRQFAHTRYGAYNLLQLIYTLWFPARTAAPGNGPDLLAGQFDGLVFRVTLAPDGTPLVYDTIHPCGCYHMFFPTPAARALPPPEPGIEWAFIPQTLPAIGAQDHLVLRVAAGTHYLEHIRVESLAPTRPADRHYSWRDYHSLRSLPRPAPDGVLQRRSLFGPEGFVAGSDRLERYLFWPMGIARAGAMRQWGRQATAFVGRRHFDDAYLMEQRFDFNTLHLKPQSP